jgi:hypothetical protein
MPMEKRYAYRFQRTDTHEVFEVEASDSTEALRKCHMESKWPAEKTAYLGRREMEKAAAREET